MTNGDTQSRYRMRTENPRVIFVEFPVGPVMERKSTRPTGSESHSIIWEEARWRLVLPAVVSATAFAMNAWPIQSQWGIAIAVIASGHPVAPMLQRCLYRRAP